MPWLICVQCLAVCHDLVPDSCTTLTATIMQLNLALHRTLGSKPSSTPQAQIFSDRVRVQVHLRVRPLRAGPEHAGIHGIPSQILSCSHESSFTGEVGG